MATSIVITSGKGGTGKTSLTGGVASCLAALGHRVLCIDMDIGLRNLDLSLGLSDRALARTLADDYLKLAPTFRGLIPYAREVVRELSGRYPMYIVTNGFAGVQQIKLRHSGLDGYFRGVVCSEDAGANKPDPRIFEYALDLAGVKAGAAVMIGDDPYSDIPGAERAGIDSIWFDPSGMPCECRPTYRIGSLRELLALL